MTAFNYERFVAGALASVLEQDYPEDRLDVIVVDDGSTDGTAEAVRAVQERAGTRIQLVQQANAGLAAATNTALRHARGELVAICDADDEWLPGKLRAQVEVFAQRPEVALVYGDMQVIDEQGSVLHPSFFGRQLVTPLRGRVLDRLVAVNCTTNSTLLLRAADAVAIPARSPYADYWLVMHAAAAGELEVIERPLSNYRLHATNMNFGVEGERMVREIKREILIRRLILTSDVSGALMVDTLVNAALNLQLQATAVATSTGTPVPAIMDVSSGDRARSQAMFEHGQDHGRFDDRLRACAIAWLLDPFNGQAWAAMNGLAAASGHLRPDGRRITIASARELITTPQLIASYCAGVDSGDAATLVVFAEDTDLPAVGARLREAFVSVGIDPEDCADVVLLPQSAWDADYAATADRLSAVAGRPS